MNSLNKKQIRKNLIRYFKAIAKAQKYTQKIQDQIVSHVRFNPISLYKKYSVLLNRIANHKPTIKGTDLKIYFIKNIKIQRAQGIKLYFLKHSLSQGQISLQQYKCIKLRFIETLIPYTPNILREVNQNITKQMQTNHVDITVQQLYKKLISIQTQNLYLLRLLQRQVNLSWNQIRTLIDEDIEECGKKIDLTIKQDTDVIYVRKWMELWTKVDEYQVLNMMRFFNGGSQKQINRIYQNKVPIIMKCTCTLTSHKQIPHHQSSKNIKFQQGSARNDTFQQTLQNNENESIVNQIKFITQQQPESNSNRNIKQSEYISVAPQYSNESNSVNILKNFLHYIETLLSNEKIIQHHRAILKPHKKEVDQILHDLTSKKKPHTKLEKILLYIQKIVDLKQKEMDRLLKTVGDIRVQNHVIFTIFSPDLVSNKHKNNKKPAFMTPKQIIFSIGTILKVFIQTKSKLIELSTSLANNSQQILKQINIVLGKHKQKIGIKQLAIFLKQFNLIYSQKEYQILASHFGDSNLNITKNSLNKVFLIQIGHHNKK